MDRDIQSLDLSPTDWLHVDVMDGHFVPRINFSDIFVRALRKAYPQRILDVHLMVSPADPHLVSYAEAGADIITVHPESGPDILRLLQHIRRLGKKAGIALNPGTSEDGLHYLLDDIDLILVMTVCPGAGGQRFLTNVLPKIKRIREMIGDRPIDLSVDGGVECNNACQLIKAGANVVVAGSSLFANNAPKENMDKLRKVISESGYEVINPIKKDKKQS
jgi:ribulose-phosphate 3-epimerase